MRKTTAALCSVLWLLQTAPVDAQEPALVPGASQNLEQMDAGNATTCVVTRGGALGCWGLAVGDGSTELPHTELTWVSNLDAVASVDVSNAVSNGTLVLGCAVLKNNRTVSCWVGRALPQAVPNLFGVTAVATGSARACAIRSGGKRYPGARATRGFRNQSLCPNSRMWLRSRSATIWS